MDRWQSTHIQTQKQNCQKAEEKSEKNFIMEAKKTELPKEWMNEKCHMKAKATQMKNVLWV